MRPEVALKGDAGAAQLVPCDEVQRCVAARRKRLQQDHHDAQAGEKDTEVAASRCDGAGRGRDQQAACVPADLRVAVPAPEERIDGTATQHLADHPGDHDRETQREADAAGAPTENAAHVRRIPADDSRRHGRGKGEAQ